MNMAQEFAERRKKDDGKICEHCGAKIVEYKHGLSKGLMRVLWRIVQLRKNQVGEFEFKKVDLNHNQAANFQKLKYWGLIEKVGSFDGHGGDWILTQQGLDFARGAISLQKYAWSYRGKLVSYEGKAVTITDIADGWKYRPDYASEAVPHQGAGEEITL